MTTSRASAASDGEAFDAQHKANRLNQLNDSEVNGSNRVFGLDGVSDNDGSVFHYKKSRPERSLTSSGYTYRPLSRSPSPYRRKDSRSPSPYRSKRVADRSRSPSPYRNKRTIDRSRSPSPFRHGRESGDSRSYTKRKGSPPRGRSEKRPHTDRSRGNDFRQNDGRRAPLSGDSSGRREVPERPQAKPISYAELENPNAVPDFRDGMPANGRSQDLSNGNHQRNSHQARSRRHDQATAGGSQGAAKQSSEQQDVEM